MKLLRLFLCATACIASAGAAMPSGQSEQGATPAGAAPADAAAALRSAEVFAQLPGVESPQISPDGKQFAARIAVGDKLYLAVMPIEGGKPRLIDPGNAQINWWAWVNDAWLVMGAGQRVPIQGNHIYVTRAYGVGATVEKIVPLVAQDAAQIGDRVLWRAKDGTPRILLSYQTSVYSNEAGFWPGVEEVDVSTGKRHPGVNARDGITSWYADGSGVVRIGVGRSNEGRDEQVLYRPDRNTAFRTIQRTKAANSDLIVPALFLSEPGKALVYDDDEHGFSALYEFDLNAMKRGKQVLGTLGFDLGGLIPDSTGTGYLGVGVSGEHGGIRWVDPDMKALDAEIAGHVKGGATQIVSVSRDNTHAIFHVGSSDSPGAYFVYDRAKGDVIPLGYVNSQLKLRRLNPVRTIHYKARDGLDIAAILTTPAGKTGKLPLIVMPHGGPFARDDESWDWIAQFMASKGYVVVQPNYRGSSGYGTSFAQAGEGQWGLAMQDDLNDAITALADQGIADPKRVCMVGGSYGGYAAMRAAQRDGALYRCAVSFAGISDMGAMLRDDSHFLNSGASSDWVRRQAPDLRSVSPIGFIGQFSIPLLLVHGAKDLRVDVDQSRSLATRLKAAGKTVEYVEQPQGDHFFSRYEDRLTYLKALEAFLAKYNPS